jgi:hypothetical protein
MFGLTPWIRGICFGTCRYFGCIGWRLGVLEARVWDTVKLSIRDMKDYAQLRCMFEAQL